MFDGFITGTVIECWSVLGKVADLLPCQRVLSYRARGESQMQEQQIKPGHLTEPEMYSSFKIACWFENRLKWELICLADEFNRWTRLS